MPESRHGATRTGGENKMSSTIAARAASALACGLALLLGACGGSAESEHVRVSVTPMLKAAAAAGFQGNGTWWNPAEPGTGFFFEAQGGTGVVTVFVFDEQGRPTWVTAAGPFTPRGNGFAFEATLTRYRGGQGAGSSIRATPTSEPVGPVSIVFEGDSAQVSWPQRSFTARKFTTSAPPAGGLVPETGIYWNPDQSGRGYTVEMIGDTASLAMFHYDERGEPTWHLVTTPLRFGAFVGVFNRYIGGQTLSGPYRVPSLPEHEGLLGASFVDACNTRVWLPNMGTLVLRRFAFGSLPPGEECRALSGANARTAADGPAVALSQTALLRPTAGVGQPAAVAVDGAGRTYFADEAQHVIWQAERDGSLRLFAGSAGNAAFRDGQGSAARFARPVGVAVDAQGVVYVSDRDNLAIRRIAPDGTVTTLAGQPGDARIVNGPLGEARFQQPGRIQADALGNLYLADGSVVRRIAGGMVSNFVGAFTVTTRYLGDGAEAGFFLVRSVGVDAAGRVLVVEQDASQQYWLRRFDAQGRMVALPHTADGTLRLPFPSDVTADGNGNLYVSVAGRAELDQLTYQAVYKITSRGVWTLYGGEVLPTYPLPATVPRLMDGPVGVAIDPTVAGGGRALVAERTGLLWQLTP
jgi:hypothetical protein